VSGVELRTVGPIKLKIGEGKKEGGISRETHIVKFET
jgi:hypothetical protein